MASRCRPQKHLPMSHRVICHLNADRALEFHVEGHMVIPASPITAARSWWSLPAGSRQIHSYGLMKI